MEHILDRDLDDDARPVPVIVASRVALGVDPHLLHRLGVDAAEGDGGAAWRGALHLEERVAVAEEVHRELRPELPRRHPRGRIVEELLQRVIVPDAALVVAPLLQHHERNGRDDVRDDANTGVDDRVLVEPLLADRRAVVAVLAGVRGADERHLLRPAGEVRVGRRDDGAGFLTRRINGTGLIAREDAERIAHAPEERLALGRFSQTCAPNVKG